MGSNLTRLAPLATTGVGSLPCSHPGEAAAHAVTAYELPFCPQLPHAYGDMLQEWLGADPERCGWAPDRDRQLPAAWDPFILELVRRPPRHGLVKLQVTGPLTLAAALARDRVDTATEIEGLAREISLWLAASVSDQVRALADLGLAVIVMVDEPGLIACGRSGTASLVWDALRATGPAWGLHVCGEVPWSLVDAAEPDVISYDLVRWGCDRRAQLAIRRLIRRGGRVMWGALDPAAPEHPEPAASRVEAAARQVAGRRSRTADVLAASLLSGSCGTGGVTPEHEHRLARGLRDIAARLRGEESPPLDRVPADGLGAAGRRDRSHSAVNPEPAISAE